MSRSFWIVSEANPNLVLDVYGASKDDRAKLVVWSHTGGDNQKFHIDDNGYFVSSHSHKVIYVEGGINQGPHIIQYSAHGGDNQKWKLHKDGTIKLNGHNLVLDIKEGKVEQGSYIIAWPHHGGPNQRWRIVNHYE